MRSWFKSDRSMDHVQEEVLRPSHDVIGVVHVEVHAGREIGKERKSDGSTLVDWSGLDYVRRIYTERKSRIGL